MSAVTRTERGWAGHFCAADRCKFRRNTLVSDGASAVVISSVGLMIVNDKVEAIGCERWYESLVFVAEEGDGYWDASHWSEIDNSGLCAETYELLGDLPDLQANDMHERMVAKYMGIAERGELAAIVEVSV